jgi:UDP-glucose 6-dehydrogenase
MFNHTLIGLGVVGGALYNSYIGKGIEVFDESTEIFSKETPIMNSKDSIVIVCVNTPMLSSGDQNPMVLHRVLDALEDREFMGTVIIKSTVLYSNILQYTDKLNIVMSPEFLNQRSANEDFYNQNYFVLGGNIINTKLVEEFYKTNFKYNTRVEGLKFEHCSMKEAIDFKYTRNILLASKVLFWEMIQDITGNSLKMSSMMKNIPTPNQENISHNGYRGYGQSLTKNADDFSACLDKDLCATLKDHEHALLQAFNDYNESL